MPPLLEGEASSRPENSIAPSLAQVSVQQRSSYLWLTVPFALREAVRSIGCFSWNAATKTWFGPATPVVAAKLQRVFPNLVTDANFERLIRSYQVAETARQVISNGALPPIPLTKTKPWRHQVAGYWFVSTIWGRPPGAANPATGGGAMLAIAMGGGKSKSAVDLITNFGFKRVLITCPLSVVDVWSLQFQLHSASGARVVPLGDDYKSITAKATQAAVEIERAKLAKQPVIVIVNHQSLWPEPFQTLALKAGFDLLLIDESHKNFKDPGGRAANFAAKLALRVPYRLLLTGTPMSHSPEDIFAQYRILDPGIFGTSFTMFRQEYAVTQEMKTRKGQPFQKILKYKNQDKLQRLFFSRAFRVEKDVLDLPPELDTQRNCTLGPEAQRVYKALEKDFIADVQSGKITVANALVRLLRLQQISSGWVTLDPSPGTSERRIVDIDTSKANLLADLLEDIEPREPVVVFARFRHDLDIIKAISTASKRRVAELSGRRNELALWQQGKADVLVAQIQAGSLGVDCTRARYCLFYSLGYSNGDYQQARARVHRPGQVRPVEYVHCLAKDTVDLEIVKALAMRQDVVDAILNLAKKEGRLF